ncbi:MAG: GTP-binding protein, partial [Akkermansia sp.]
DSMDLEREKGITIKAKNTSIHWNGYTVNIVDTPGHADFGAEVERVMKMVDGVILVVDAYEGPQAQTRFVLRKALEEGLLPIVVINKIDRPHADPLKVRDQVLELLLDLDASEEQFEAPFVYGSARDGYFMNSPEGEPPVDCTPLLQQIIKHIPAPKGAEADKPFKMLISNIDWDDYVGRVAVGRITSGTVQKGDTLYLLRPDGSKVQAKVTKLFEYSGLQDVESAVGEAGNIIGLSGFEDVDIGETLVADPEDSALPFVDIEPPTVEMEFSINDGPLGGQDGKNVTSRIIRERLMREMRTNISIKVEDTELAGVFRVSARGTMQIAILVEQMRREDYEVLVSRPKVITRTIDGQTCEPFETVFIEVPDACSNGAIRILGNRRGILESMDSNGNGRTTIRATMPTRGIIGFEFELVNLTSGHGIFSHLFKEYAPYAGAITTRQTSTLVSMENGIASPSSLQRMEERGPLFISPGDAVYEGMIVGENPKDIDIPVNKELVITMSIGRFSSSNMP